MWNPFKRKPREKVKHTKDVREIEATFIFTDAEEAQSAFSKTFVGRIGFYRNIYTDEPREPYVIKAEEYLEEWLKDCQKRGFYPMEGTLQCPVHRVQLLSVVEKEHNKTVEI